MSDVVCLTYPQAEIAVITMEDRINKNTITKELMSGILDAFATIETNADVKVVITRGFDNYYCCGGSLDVLSDFNKGIMTLNSSNFYIQPLTCKVPTIAAVQGHAIGGGLAFACMHDFLFLSSHATYSANFMKYGFTPGMGSTYTIPEKFGTNCGHQLLYSAKQYTSKDLKALNCFLPFYEKEIVFEQAQELAKDISNKTLLSVKLLKEQLSEKMRLEIAEVIKREGAMHDQTIVTDEARQRIKENYGL